MGLRAGRHVRVLVAVVLLIATGPWMPVLCYASGHTAFESLDAHCCGATGGSRAESQSDPQLLSRTTASRCRDCTDAPFASVWPQEPAPREVTPGALPASLPAPANLPFSPAPALAVDRAEGEFPLSLETSAAPLRC